MQNEDLLKIIVKNLNTIRKSREVVEVRILKTKKGTISGNFDDYELLAAAVVEYVGKTDIYISLNPVKPELLARCSNRLQPYTKQTTGDRDIAAINYVLVDIDPIRASGISATKEEKAAALQLAKRIRKDLMARGLPEPFFCDSGNGFHLLIPADLENTLENVRLIKEFLSALDLMHSTDRAEVDRTTHNPSRIVKLYGTLACKGDDTEERPHRWSRIIKAPDKLVPVPRELLAEIAAQMPAITGKKHQKSSAGNDFDLDKWLQEHGIKVSFKAPFHDQGTKYILDVCPWNNDHTDRSAYIIKFHNGAIAAGCHHNGCQDQNWSTLRHLLEGEPVEDESGDEKQANNIIRLAKDFRYFKSDLEEPFAAVKMNDHNEVMDITSKRFKLYLTKLYYEATGGAPDSDAMSQALKVMEMKAIFSDGQVNLQKRIALNDDCYYYDLCDSEWRAVKIGEKGCSIEDQPPILFTRNKNMKAQLEPDFKVNATELVKLVKKHFRFKKTEDCVLFTVYLASCFLPQIAHVILVLFGEKGSAKSTTMRMVKRIVDPAMQDLLSMPTSKQDLAILLANTYLPAFDNLDSLSAEKSDMLCMAATGGAFSKRTLYTDSDETILRFKRCVALNGINVVASRADLLDRSIVLELERISKKDRKTEKAVWDSFEKDIPGFLGAILNTLAAAIRVREGVVLQHVGRMADFTYWGYAIAEVLGIGGNTFLDVYLNNQDRANEEALASNPVAAAVMALMKDKNIWSSSVSVLLKEIETVAEQERINTRVKTWPKDPFVLSKRLKEVKSNLEEIGIFYDIRHAGNYKKVTIENHNNSKLAAREAPEDEPDELD